MLEAISDEIVSKSPGVIILCSYEMIYTAIDTFYLTDEQLKDSPSGKAGIDEATETTLRVYGCDLIQESGILLKLPQAVMATGQVLFHRFYCKKSLARFGVKKVAASCVWLASKLEESPRRAKHVIIVFHRMECRRENLSIEHFDVFSEKYTAMKNDLIRTERHLLKQMGFICHVEHPHKFISNYLATLGAPPELRQEAWNLANDSLRTALCVRFKSEVVACGVVYAAARRFQIPLPDNPPWWLVFDADKAGIDEVCRVLALLYSFPKAQYMSVCTEKDSFASIVARTPDAHALKESLQDEDLVQKTLTDVEATLSKEMKTGRADEKLKETKKGENDATKSVTANGVKASTDPLVGGKSKEDSERRKEREKEWARTRDRDRDREYDAAREKEKQRERDRLSSRDRSSAHSEKRKLHSSRDHGGHRSTSYSSRDKDHRPRHHPHS